MDDCRFDNWTRMLGKLQARRAALKEMAGAGAALFSLAKLDLGLVQAQDVSIAGCSFTGDKCKKGGDCCSNNCSGKKKKKKKGGGGGKHKKNKKEGKCRCQDQGKSCNVDAGCCQGLCNGGVCRCAEKNERCNKDADCCGSKNCADAGGGNKACA